MSHRSYALIDQLSEREPVEAVCSALMYRGLATTPIDVDATVSMLAALRCVAAPTDCSARVEAQPAAAASWAYYAETALRLAVSRCEG